jgi:uncharacterized SAM-binding protein YcdF (DUF218 family)
MTANRRRLMRIVGSIALATFALCTLTPMPNLLGRLIAVPAAMAPADAIVVLGSGALLDDSLSDESMRRFIHGVHLYNQRLAPIMLLLGPSPQPRKQKRPEAEIRAQIAHEIGIPSEAVIVAPNAYTTQQESKSTAELLRPRGAHKILLVTESMHMRRARLLFERAGFEVIPAASDHYAETSTDPDSRFWLTLRTVQELTALLYYRIAGYI